MFRIPRFNNDDPDVDALIARADVHFSARRMTEAIVAYRQVLSVRPRDAHALHRMGLACVHTNDMERAHGYLEQALHAAPDRAELWEHAGLLAALAGKHESAEAFYRRAIILAGSTASLHRNLGDCLRLSGHLTEAITHYEKSIEIEPGLHHAIRALARIHAQLGQLDSAAHYWRRAWTLEPASLNDGLGLIAVLAKSGRMHELANAITQIRIRFAGDANALKALAFVLNTSDRFNDALSVARQGLAIDPHHPLLHHNAARSQHMRKNRRKSAA